MWFILQFSFTVIAHGLVTCMSDFLFQCITNCVPLCEGVEVTILGTDEDDTIEGTENNDVTVTAGYRGVQ